MKLKDLLKYFRFRNSIDYELHIYTPVLIDFSVDIFRENDIISSSLLNSEINFFQVNGSSLLIYLV